MRSVFTFLAAVLLAAACSEEGNGGDADTDSDSDVGTDSDSDADADTDADTDADADSDADTDSDADADADTDTDSDADTDADTDPVGVDFTVLDYNVGNPDSADPYYPLRMQSQAYEDHVAGVIQELAPAIVFLQEVLSAKTCEAFTETDPTKTCYEWTTRPRPAERLLGPDYSVVCDARDHVECVGVRIDFGTIEGLAPGEYVESGAETPELPLPSCDWAAGECTDDLCDAESTVSAITVSTDAGPLRVAHLHPMAQVSAFVSGDPCRTEQLLQVFEGYVLDSEEPLVAGADRALAIGDWNLGLEVYWWRTGLGFGPSDADDVFDEYVNCDGCAFFDRDPRDEWGDRYSTTSVAYEWMDDLGLPIAIDHVVVSAGIDGACAVHDDGGDPATERLDAYFPGLGELGEDERIDHYAITCDLHVEP
jgi:hypothetical protein